MLNIAIDSRPPTLSEEKARTRSEGIANVANYVKTHPRARPHEIQQYVEGQIAVFKTKI